MPVSEQGPRRLNRYGRASVEFLSVQTAIWQFVPDPGYCTEYSMCIRRVQGSVNPSLHSPRGVDIHGVRCNAFDSGLIPIAWQPTGENVMMGFGIMDEIRVLLSQGRTSGECISFGYRPGTVYKVQRQSKTPIKTGEASPNSGSPTLFTRDDFERDHWEWTEHLEDLVEQDEHRIEGLSADVRMLEQQIADLQPLALANQRLNDCLRDLEKHLEQANRAHLAIGHVAEGSARRFETERSERDNAEVQVEELSIKWTETRRENERLRSETNEAFQAAEAINESIQEITVTVNGLIPLKVWTGHPCKVCKKPLSGAVERKSAASLLKDFSHAKCLDAKVVILTGR